MVGEDGPEVSLGAAGAVSVTIGTPVVEEVASVDGVETVAKVVEITPTMPDVLEPPYPSEALSVGIAGAEAEVELEPPYPSDELNDGVAEADAELEACVADAEGDGVDELG